MLILIRKAEPDHDSVRISHPDGDVWVRVLEVYRGRVSLGVHAPKSVQVLRGELIR